LTLLDYAKQKNRFVVSIVIGITITGAIILGQGDSNDPLDKYAIDDKTVFAQLQNNLPILLVDIRDVEQFEAGHLKGSARDNLNSATLEKRITTIQKRLPEVASTYNLVLVDDNGTIARERAQTITAMGIQTFYLEGGMNNLSENIISSTQTTIDSKELSQKIITDEDLFLLDVRQPEELLESKIKGIVNIPLAELFQPNGVDKIPKDKPVIVICGSGNRATIASYVLAQEDIGFVVLEGGMKAWNASMEEETSI
jgi:rhodanese-related sulfurtransferase